MTVFEFVSKYKKIKIIAEKQRLVKSILNNAYIPIMNKYKMAHLVKVKSNGDILMQYIYTCISIIELYTNLSIIQSDDVIQIFDALNEERIFDEVISNISKNEIDEYNMVIDMVSTQSKEVV